VHRLCDPCRRICLESSILNDEAWWKHREAQYLEQARQHGSRPPSSKERKEPVHRWYEHHRHHSSVTQLIISALKGCHVCAHLAHALRRDLRDRKKDDQRAFEELLAAENALRDAMNASFGAENVPLAQAAVLQTFNTQDQHPTSPVRSNESFEGFCPSGTRECMDKDWTCRLVAYRKTTMFTETAPSFAGISRE
jgi:hypothetical protein